MKIKEQTIQKAIKDYLEAIGWVVVKINNVGIKKNDGSYIPTHQVGVSDLICCTPEGEFVAIEVKRPGNKPTENQKRFLKRVNATGGLGLWATSIDEVMKDYKTFKSKKRD